MPDQRPFIGGANGQLAPDDQVRLATLEDVDGAFLEVRVTKIDFVAKHEVALGEQDPLLERLAVVGLAQTDDLDLTPRLLIVLGRELMADFDGSVLRAVFGEDDFVAPPEG